MFKRNSSVIFVFVSLVFVWHSSATADNLGKIRVLEKSEWGGHPIKKHGVEKNQYKKMGKIKFLSVHYTGSRAQHERWSENILLRYVQEGHQENDNFGDIAYHYLIGKSGAVYKGRNDKIAPATRTHYYSPTVLKGAKYNSVGELLQSSVPKRSAPGNTAGHITVTFIIGVGEPKLFSRKTMKVAANVIAELLVKYDLTPASVRAHREIAITNCPGDEVYTWLRGKGRSRFSEGVGMKLIKRRYARLKN